MMQIVGEQESQEEEKNRDLIMSDVGCLILGNPMSDILYQT